ncbi:hypothetical protein BaRGS_00010557 [Batillaria attramentaria]|uniref:Uncharacterized protein n=1 Tax=Batillaria attramentaria TaxID=370345 RepID=A0ABD0LGW1_9CAEN
MSQSDFEIPKQVRNTNVKSIQRSYDSCTQKKKRRCENVLSQKEGKYQSSCFTEAARTRCPKETGALRRQPSADCALADAVHRVLLGLTSVWITKNNMDITVLGSLTG